MNRKLNILLEREIRLTMLEVDFVKGLAILESDMVKACRNYKPQVNEGLSTVIGLWLSGPYVVKLFGKFVSYLDGIAQKYLKKGFGGKELSEKILEFAEKYHHKVMWIFEKVAGKFTKDHDKAEHIAELLYTIVIGALLGQTVGDSFTSITNSGFSADVLAKAAKASVKAGELITGVENAFKAFLPTITSAAQQ